MTVDWNLPCLLSVLRLIYSTSKSSIDSQKLETVRGKFIICQVKETRGSRTGTDPKPPDSIKLLTDPSLVFLIYTTTQKSKGLDKIQTSRSVFMWLKDFFRSLQTLQRYFLKILPAPWRTHLLHSFCPPTDHVVRCAVLYNHQWASPTWSYQGEAGFVSNFPSWSPQATAIPDTERRAGDPLFCTAVLSCKGWQRKEGTATLKHRGSQIMRK